MLIVKYRESWVEDFEKIKSKIGRAMANLFISIEHIGSTAVPNLAAKAIIDIDLVINAALHFEDVKRQLASIGYYHNGNQGIYGREVFKRNKAENHDYILDHIPHHLYVCDADSPELKRHLLFRNYLLNNDDARTEYQNLKYKIAEAAGNDKKKYASLKETEAGKFINDIVEMAGKTG